MQVTRIDPRDVRFELNEPDYRVYFFEPDGRSDEYPPDRGAGRGRGAGLGKGQCRRPNLRRVCVR